MNPVARHSAGLSLALLICYLVWTIAGAVSSIDRFTGSDAAVMQMQIDAIRIEQSLINEGK